MSPTETTIAAIIDELRAERRVAFCAIVATQGSTPQPVGSILAVLATGEAVGTLGGGCIEADVIRRAHALIDTSGSALLSFHLDHNSSEYSGLICGGSLDVAVSVLSGQNHRDQFMGALDAIATGRATVIPMHLQTEGGDSEYRVRIEAPPKLIIAGAGHVSRILAQLAIPLGFHVTVIDDRDKYANPERFPPPIKTIAGNIQRTLSQISIDSSTYIVIVTRGHRQDRHALKAVLNSPARYIGMIGSQQKIETTYEDLLQDGASSDQLSRVCAPIGLDIGAVSTEEIALSIAAELVAVRRKDFSHRSDRTTLRGEQQPK